MASLGPDWDGLQRGISGKVVLPGSAGYDQAHPPFIAWWRDLRPQAVVRCATPEDTAEVIRFCRRHRIQVSPRGGGHSFAGHSSTRGVILDVTPMCSVVVGDGVAKVGAGTHLGELYERLLAHGLTVPAGTCPSVSIGGLTLGGGHGILGRSRGLTLDHLLEAQVVLADGRLVACDEHHHPDLFWALRGAGAGNFGVLTSLTFQPLPAQSMTNFHLVFPYVHAADAIAAWQMWAPYGPDELTADLALTAAPDPAAEPTVEVYGAMLGARRDALDLIGDLVARVGADPVSHDCNELSHDESIRYQGRLSGATQLDAAPPRSTRRGHRFTKSEFFDRPLPGQAIALLIDNFARRREPGQERGVEFAPWGGAYNRRPPEATAFAHRDQIFLLEHLIVVDPETADVDTSAAHQWVRRSWASVHPWGAGRVYPNFPDPELEDRRWVYYGENYARLLGIKGGYDPDGVFRSL